MQDTVRMGLIGCGNIAGHYMNCLKGAEGIEVIGVVDLNTEVAKAFAEEHGLKCFASAEELLADPSLDLVINLTIHHAHFPVTKAALEAGKHVFSEKPLTTDPDQAHELVRIARENGVRLGCAPVTYLGEAQQTCAQLVRNGSLGEIRVVYAEVNHDRIENWHPFPSAFYEVGPVWDVGPYAVAFVTSILGPVRTVQAFGKVVHARRARKDGTSFSVESPEFVVAMLELACGTTVRLTTNFYVGAMTPSQQNVEFHGLKGSCIIDSWFGFNARVRAAEFGEPLQDVPSAFPKACEGGIEWSRGLRDMADAIRNDRPHRCSGEHAAHVTDVLCAINRSVEKEGLIQHLTSDFPLPQPWEPLMT